MTSIMRFPLFAAIMEVHMLGSLFIHMAASDALLNDWSVNGCLLQVWDVETGIDKVLLDMNPDGWIEGVTTEK